MSSGCPSALVRTALLWLAATNCTARSCASAVTWSGTAVRPSRGELRFYHFTGSTEGFIGVEFRDGEVVGTY